MGSFGPEHGIEVLKISHGLPQVLEFWRIIASRLEAIAFRLKAIGSRLEPIASIGWRHRF